MELELQKKLIDNPKMYQYLKENSFWVKDLNRNSDYYSKFLEAMKERYRLRTTDKISAAIDNIDLISSFLGAFKA